jgi:hypothetical protein
MAWVYYTVWQSLVVPFQHQFDHQFDLIDQLSFIGIFNCLWPRLLHLQPASFFIYLWDIYIGERVSFLTVWPSST